MRQTQQTRLGVRVLAVPTSEAHRVTWRGCPARLTRTQFHVLAQRSVALINGLVIRRITRGIGPRPLALDEAALGVVCKVIADPAFKTRPQAVRCPAVESEERPACDIPCTTLVTRVPPP